MLKFMWKLGERMNVLSKKHSSELIRDLNLNRVPEILLDSYDEMKIGDFCDKYNEPIYILRDLESPNGMFFVCKSKKFKNPIEIAVKKCYNRSRKNGLEYNLRTIPVKINR